MALLDKYAKGIVELSMDPRFAGFLTYFTEQEKLIQHEINAVATPQSEREALVRLRDWLDREVLQLVSRAHKALERSEEHNDRA